MQSQQVKKSFNPYQQKAFQRYAKAKLVDLPGLISERYGISFLGSQNSRNRDAQGHGLRLGMVDGGENGPVWLATGVAKGDAVQTVMQLDLSYLNKETKKDDAIQIIEDYQRSMGVAATHANPAARLAPKAFLLPAATQDKEGKLLEYVRFRGVSWSTVNAAQEAGFLDKTPEGLRFIGLDGQGKPRSAEVRLIEPKIINGKLSKIHCLPGSDRTYPPVLPGTDKEIHVVEGGFSALGLKEIMNHEGRDPTIIMTGGKDNIAWTRQPHIQVLLNGAQVTIWGETEKSEKVQQEADEALINQAEAIKQAGAAEVVYARPPTSLKDTADWNVWLKQQQKALQIKLR